MSWLGRWMRVLFGGEGPPPRPTGHSPRPHRPHAHGHHHRRHHEEEVEDERRHERDDDQLMDAGDN